MPDLELDVRSVVAYYGVQLTPARLEKLYAHIIEWFAKVGATPDRLAVTGDGFNGKLRSFRSMDQLLQKSGFAHVTQFTVYQLEAGGTVPLWDWRVCADMSPAHAWFMIGASPSFASLPGDSLLSISQAVVVDLAPTYGIGYRRQMEFGPTLYGAGLCQGLQPWGSEKPEGEKIDDWRRIGLEQHVYEQGILRGIYPWNFVTEVHLTRQIEGVSLRRWIERDKERGTLRPLGNDVVLWEVPDQKAGSLESILQQNGLIFDAKDFRQDDEE